MRRATLQILCFIQFAPITSDLTLNGCWLPLETDGGHLRSHNALLPGDQKLAELRYRLALG